MRTRLPAAALALLLAAPLAGAATTADAGTSTPASCSSRTLHPDQQGPVRFEATAGGVTAALTGSVVTRDYDQWLQHPQLTVSSGDGENSWQVEPRPAPDSFKQRYRVGAIGLGKQAGGYVCVVRFGGTSYALLSVYAGGAHCCTTIRLFDPASRTRTAIYTGNAGANVLVVNGHPLLHTWDDAFSYVFADFADSGAPLRLLLPNGHTVADVTRQHPALVRADARRQWALAGDRRIRLGFYAAWAADEEMLGHDARVWSTLHRLNQNGRLSLPKGEQGYGWAEGKKYIAKLRRFLDKQGYLS